MDKIASPQDLQAELRRLLAYAQTEKPSREKLATGMRVLAARVSFDRVAATDADLKKLAQGTLKSLESLADSAQDLYGKEPKGSTKGEIASMSSNAFVTVKTIVKFLSRLQP
jgi:hypothetical protein